MTIAIQREPSAIGVEVGASSVAGGAANVKPILHDSLAVEYDVGAWRPQLGAALPSLEAGTWRLLPDGRMETLWVLRPGISWHDGAPLTTADLLFTFTVFKDPGIPSAAAGRH